MANQKVRKNGKAIGQEGRKRNPVYQKGKYKQQKIQNEKYKKCQVSQIKRKPKRAYKKPSKPLNQLVYLPQQAFSPDINRNSILKTEQQCCVFNQKQSQDLQISAILFRIGNNEQKKDLPFKWRPRAIGILETPKLIELKPKIKVIDYHTDSNAQF